ncbi:MAG: hypothetical protein R3301_00530 [Saprospiraceae bacterium]|nr:hypothetical protein [Saprospiraceae bacterium]
MSGYSKTPLARKLGLKEDFRVHLINPPADYHQWIAPHPPVSFTDQPPFDFVHFFVNETEVLEEGLKQLRQQIVPNGMIWVSWHKKASRLPSEITEDVIRGTALALGLVDIKVCAVTEIWSGLKVVIRKELR